MTAGNPPKGIRVLVVSSQPIVRAGLKTTLEQHKSTLFIGEASDNTKDAIAKARRLAPDVILFGPSETTSSEIELIQSLREKTPEAKILVLGEDDDARYILSLLRAGAHGYSSKTSSTSEVIRATKAIHKGDMFLSPAISRAVLELGEAGGARDGGSEAKLSPRESQVLGLIAKGLTNRQIGERLGISARTVETHRERVMRKLDIHTVAGLTRYAIEHGVSDENDLP